MTVKVFVKTEEGENIELGCLVKNEDLKDKELKKLMLKEIQQSKLIKRYSEEGICDEIYIGMPEDILERYLHENFEDAYDRARCYYHIVGFKIFPFYEMKFKNMIPACNWEKLRNENILMILFTLQDGIIKDKEIIRLEGE